MTNMYSFKLIIIEHVLRKNYCSVNCWYHLLWQKSVNSYAM